MVGAAVCKAAAQSHVRVWLLMVSALRFYCILAG